MDTHTDSTVPNCIWVRNWLCLVMLTFFRPAGACNFFEKRLEHRCFLVNIVRFLRIHFFKEHLWWLLLLIGCMVQEFMAWKRALWRRPDGITRNVLLMYFINVPLWTRHLHFVLNWQNYIKNLKLISIINMNPVFYLAYISWKGGSKLKVISSLPKLKVIFCWQR